MRVSERQDHIGAVGNQGAFLDPNLLETWP
jgi:hypothetical protein